LVSTNRGGSLKQGNPGYGEPGFPCALRGPHRARGASPLPLVVRPFLPPTLRHRPQRVPERPDLGGVPAANPAPRRHASSTPPPPRPPLRSNRRQPSRTPKAPIDAPRSRPASQYAVRTMGHLMNANAAHTGRDGRARQHHTLVRPARRPRWPCRHASRGPDSHGPRRHAGARSWPAWAFPPGPSSGHAPQFPVSGVPIRGSQRAARVPPGAAGAIGRGHATSEGGKLARRSSRLSGQGWDSKLGCCRGGVGGTYARAIPWLWARAAPGGARLPTWYDFQPRQTRGA